VAVVITTPGKARKRVLNAGSGPGPASRLHPLFDAAQWVEVRLDIDPRTKPDIVSSIVDMRLELASGSFDAIWCSHILEHLYAHEVPAALAEFQRVLKPDGFALITCPDLETVAELIASDGLDGEAYRSPAGPITPLDMLFGHSPSIAQGQVHMAHNTGFTCARLGRLLAGSGFAEILAKRGRFDLWALALMPDAAKGHIQQQLHSCGLSLFDEPE
jgi:SAM-dependent methyltransferase